MPRELSLVHLVREPARSDGARPPLLLLLHGLKEDERGLHGLSAALDDRLLRVSARGIRTIRPGAFAWYHVTFAPEGPIVDPAEVEGSRLAILGFIDELVSAYGADPDRVFLMGFSQGAIMSLAVALTEPEKIAGVVSMSGRIPPGVVPRIAAAERLAGLPIFAAHGTQDRVLPIEHGRAARELISRYPIELEYKEYPMGHLIGPESLREASAWLGARVGDASRERRTGSA
jgi:phospholipase/carboxylesterase